MHRKSLEIKTGIYGAPHCHADVALWYLNAGKAYSDLGKAEAKEMLTKEKLRQKRC